MKGGSDMSDLVIGITNVYLLSDGSGTVTKTELALGAEVAFSPSVASLVFAGSGQELTVNRTKKISAAVKLDALDLQTVGKFAVAPVGGDVDESSRVYFGTKGDAAGLLGLEVDVEVSGAEDSSNGAYRIVLPVCRKLPWQPG